VKKLTGSFKKFEKKSEYLDESDIIQGPKKFVFQIDPENIKFIESLSYQDKQDLINYLITKSRSEINEEYKYSQLIRRIKKGFIYFILVAIGLPLFFYLASYSLELTKANYSEMQRNFEKLF
jgi:hypothetical protein